MTTTMILEIMDFVAKEWPLISRAPDLAIGGALGLIAATAILVWFLKGAIDRGELRANRERLELARDRQVDAETKLTDLERQFADLRVAISANAGESALNEKSLEVGSALVAARQANDAVHFVLTAEPGNYGVGSGEGSFGS